MGPTTVESGPLAVDSRDVKQGKREVFRKPTWPYTAPFRENAHVLSLLLAQEQEAAPGAYQDRSPGSIGEAAWYVEMARIDRTQIDGALVWLEELALRAHLLL